MKQSPQQQVGLGISFTPAECHGVLITHPSCSICEAATALVGLEKLLEEEISTFECRNCGHYETVVGKSH